MSTVMASGERQRIETVIEKTASKMTYWQQISQTLQNESDNGQLSPHYRIVGHSFAQAETRLERQGKVGVQSLPPSAQAAAFELGAAVARIAEQQGEETAQQVASFLCTALKGSAQWSQHSTP